MAMPVPTVTNHAPVTVALIAAAAANVIMHYSKAKFGVDFAGLESDLQVLATGFGYLVAGKVAQ